MAVKNTGELLNVANETLQIDHHHLKSGEFRQTKIQLQTNFDFIKVALVTEAIEGAQIFLNLFANKICKDWKHWDLFGVPSNP